MVKLLSPPVVIAAVGALLLWSNNRGAAAEDRGPAVTDQDLAEALLSSGEDTDDFFDPGDFGGLNFGALDFGDAGDVDQGFSQDGRDFGSLQATIDAIEAQAADDAARARELEQGNQAAASDQAASDAQDLERQRAFYVSNLLQEQGIPSSFFGGSLAGGTVDAIYDNYLQVRERYGNQLEAMAGRAHLQSEVQKAIDFFSDQLELQGITGVILTGSTFEEVELNAQQIVDDWAQARSLDGELERERLAQLQVEQQAAQLAVDAGTQARRDQLLQDAQDRAAATALDRAAADRAAAEQAASDLDASFTALDDSYFNSFIDSGDDDPAAPAAEDVSFSDFDPGPASDTGAQDFAAEDEGFDAPASDVGAQDFAAEDEGFGGAFDAGYDSYEVDASFDGLEGFDDFF